MRKLLLLLVLTLCGPASAQQMMEDLYIHLDGEVVNIRVSLRNTTGRTQGPPVTVELYARPMGADQWSPVQTWTNITKLAPGHRVSRDYFSKDGDLVTQLALQEHFEVRAVVTAPGISEETQRVAEHDPSHQH